jgi:hypothetical protein
MHGLSAHAWDYLPALQTVFESVGFDYLYHVNDFNKEKFNAFMGLESICDCFLNSFWLTNYLSTANWLDKEV